MLGIDDKFIEHGTNDDLYRECGIDAKGITKTVLDLLGKKDLPESHSTIES
jgi:1-deoxy-D-xylulose-5-phosphate synthase